MPLLSTEEENKSLRARIAELESQIEKLRIDPSYQILTRAALELELARPGVRESIRSVIFLDIDNLHETNRRIGHEEANRRISQALKLRDGDLLVKGKWYSGDEIAILIPTEDGIGVIQRLQMEFEKEGLSFTGASIPFSGDVFEDVRRAKIIVDRLKQERGDKR